MRHQSGQLVLVPVVLQAILVTCDGEDHIKSIARIQLKGLVARLEQQGFQVEVSEELLSRLAHAGFDPVYGARPLKRAIQQKVENPLAQAILSGRVVPGKLLRLGADGNGLTLSQ
ncbi:hypothetical protein ATO46_15345 [Aeromonas schubertii]|nr:hypothetical protein ATO46_15345 [Aeromonas schubertii]